MGDSSTLNDRRLGVPAMQLILLRNPLPPSRLSLQEFVCTVQLYLLGRICVGQKYGGSPNFQTSRQVDKKTCWHLPEKSPGGFAFDTSF